VIGDDANLPSPLAGEGRPKAGERGYTPLALKRAKSLRKNQTEQESKLWQFVRGHRFASFKFRRQQPMGDYIVDFVCHAAKLIIELDGEQHGEDVAIRHDERRARFLERSGYRIVRFSNAEFLTNTQVILDFIYNELTNPSPGPAGHPLPQGERDYSGA
jgi:very-short-patch-repair endonuclease